MLAVLRPGRKVDIVYPDMAEYPINCTILGEPTILPVTAQIQNGELVPWRSSRLVKFWSDRGVRTVRVADLVMR